MDINEQIAANTGLVYTQLHRFNMVDDPDAESKAFEALYKAVKTFDASKGFTFSTYAMCVIKNALRMHLRSTQKKRQLSVFSYDTPDPLVEGKSMLDHIITDNDVETVLLQEEACKIITDTFVKHKNALSEEHRAIIDMWYSKMTQTEIAKRVHLSQSYVSRIIAGFMYKLRKELEEYM